MTFLIFAGSVALLVLGAELLVRGSSRLAVLAGVSRLVVGLTVVAFGTSSPELAVSLKAALTGMPDLAYGNVVGSNICNVLLILGLASLAAPLSVPRPVLRRDLPWMAAVSAIALLLALDGRVGRLDGAALLALGVVYTAWSIRQERSTEPPAPAPEGGPAPAKRAWRDVASVLAGLALLVLGAQGLVSAAVRVARQIGVSELVIGLTVVAVGTSLPEIATSVLASVRGEREIAVGNVVGSNILNLCAVLGLTALIARGGVAVDAHALRWDTPIMLAVALVCFPLFLKGSVVSRLDGLLLAGLYAAYAAWLVLKAQTHPALPRYEAALVLLVPAIVTGFLVAAVRSVRVRLQRR